MVELLHVNFCTHYEAESEKELRQLLLEMGHLRQPEILPNRDLHFDPNNLEESRFIFSDHSPGGQVPIDGTEFELDFNPDEPEMHIHINTTSDVMGDMFEYYESILPVEEVSLNAFSVHFQVEKGFGEIGIHNKFPADSEITAFRLESDGDDYSFVQDEPGVRVRFEMGERPKVTKGNVIRDVESYIDRAHQYVEDVYS